ncbi:YggS family pyridoxal phosphate-dependent enzyme [Candidatus Pelagibacter sp.]|nr:YggS family pyridoxal phosphate-dependent enzyme [Candidatus Pelagibacter sp.]
MHKSINNLAIIEKQIKSRFDRSFNSNIIAVCKTFPFSEIKPLIDYGHLHFGENKVQESLEKWSNIKNSYANLKLHMIGKLQTNKVKYVIPLFDYIHSLDNLKLAEKIFIEQKKLNKYLKIFIQVNIGNEQQKGGIDPKNLKEFYNECVSKFKLNIVGLMCIPPNEGDVKFFFNQMFQLNNSLNLKELSMGMSSDFLEAIEQGSTFVRIGSKIFGDRH